MNFNIDEFFLFTTDVLDISLGSLMLIDENDYRWEVWNKHFHDGYIRSITRRHTEMIRKSAEDEEDFHKKFGAAEKKLELKMEKGEVEIDNFLQPTLEMLHILFIEEIEAKQSEHKPATVLRKAKKISTKASRTSSKLTKKKRSHKKRNNKTTNFKKVKAFKLSMERRSRKKKRSSRKASGGAAKQ